MNLNGVEIDSIVDGPGIRMTIFFQGCPHHCEGCHNPETWDYNDVRLKLSVSDIMYELDNDELLSGVTISGGEPLSPCNFEELYELVKEIKKRKKNIWLYTGYVLDDVLKKYPILREKLLPYIDVIVDGAFILEKRNLLLHFRGSENQRLIDVQKYLHGDADFLYEK